MYFGYKHLARIRKIELSQAKELWEYGGKKYKDGNWIIVPAIIIAFIISTSSLLYSKGMVGLVAHILILLAGVIISTMTTYLIIGSYINKKMGK